MYAGPYKCMLCEIAHAKNRFQSTQKKIFAKVHGPAKMIKKIHFLECCKINFFAKFMDPQKDFFFTFQTV